MLWSRIGNFDQAELDRLMWQDRSLFEYWAHCASIVPTDDYPIHNLMMRNYPSRDGVVARRLKKWVADNDKLRRYILTTLRKQGPLPSRELTEAMVKAKATCVAYETIEDKNGRLPLLTPMSEVAGRMAIQEGAKYLEKPMMGRGILLGGIPGVEPAYVVILGGGVVGSNAAKIAAGLGANVAILDVIGQGGATGAAETPERLRRVYPATVRMTCWSIWTFTGLVRWVAKPASRLRRRSSSWPKPLSAIPFVPCRAAMSK